MAGALTDPTRAPVAFGRRAVPQLFGELQRAGAAARLRALTSLCDLVHEPERLYQAVTGGFLKQLKVLFRDEDPSVRAKTCELLHLLTSHSIGSFSDRRENVEPEKLTNDCSGKKDETCELNKRTMKGGLIRGLS
uniref:Uncharacterized protein n=1 Tax=Oreochromis niloticus TaxID=8128 RepID=A0A669EWU3_ORENI